MSKRKKGKPSHAAKNNSVSAMPVHPPNKKNTSKDEDYESKRDIIYSAAKQMYAAMAKQVQLGELNKITYPTYKSYTKDNYRQYIENPGRNEKELRNMSQFLSRVSMPYRRILWYFATMYLFYWNLTPKINILEPPDHDELMAAFTEECKIINKLDLSQEMVNVMFFTLRDGIFYGFVYEDDESSFIYRLDPDYCRPIQIEDGVFNIAFDFSYFQKYPAALETWDPVFTTGYNAYQKDTQNKWQLLEPSKTICIKAQPDLEEHIPFFIGLFEALLDLIDARTLQRNKDVIQNYKLILQKIPLFDSDNSKTVDDFRIAYDTMQAFNSQLQESVPEAIGVATTPMEIDTVDFTPDDNSSDLNSSSMKQVFDDSGVSQLIFNSNTSGSVGVEASVKTDAALAFTFVKSIEKWMQRFLKYREGNISFDFEILDVHIFNKDSAITRELSLANSGVTNKTKLAATSGLTPDKMLNAQIWENDYLRIHENWIPLQTSYTMASTGRPESDETSEANDSTSENKDSGENEKIEE